MSNFFNPDAPFMQGLSKIADMMLLNIITIICSIPVVTAGVAFTALYDAMGRSVRDEGGIYKGYFKALKTNFKQSTIMWLLVVVVGALLIFSMVFYVSNNMKIILVFSALFVLLWAMVSAWIFPLQARFENTIKNTIKNALLCGLGYFPRSLIMIALNMLPLALFLFWTNMFVQISFVWITLWYGLTAYITTMLLRKPFNRIMGVEEEAPNPDEDLEQD